MKTIRLLLTLVVCLVLTGAAAARTENLPEATLGSPAVTPGDFVDNGDGTVSDRTTGLMWQKGYTAGLGWKEAQSLVESLYLAGHDDWRLPRLAELQGVDPVYFDSPSAGDAGGRSVAFWSATPRDGGPETGTYATLGGGQPGEAGTRHYVRAVRDEGFTLTSEVGVDGGTLPAEYTCDGTGDSPQMDWSNAPSGTQEFALMMSTIPVDGNTKWEWVLYGIPSSVSGLAKNSAGVGTLGVSSRGSRIYEPPCSQGPGAKVYTFTIHALSSSPQLPSDPSQVTGAVLTQAVSGITLASASLSLSYTRPDGPPTAAFEFSPTAPVTIQPVSFTDASTGSPSSWAWDFGDGSASTLQNPTHAYSAPGTYTVSLTAANAKGSDTATEVVTVASACTVTSVAKAASPFRLKVGGTNFLPGCSVLVNGLAAPTTLYKGAALLVAKGDGLSAMVPKGVTVQIAVKNPDGTQSAPFDYTR